jgi:hypothetical protein
MVLVATKANAAIANKRYFIIPSPASLFDAGTILTSKPKVASAVLTFSPGAATARCSSVRPFWRTRKQSSRSRQSALYGKPLKIGEGETPATVGVSRDAA